MTDGRKQHWELAYDTGTTAEHSWYQAVPERSLEFIRAAGLRQDESILDVGGGDSLLVDYLLAQGYTDVSVLDLAPNALAVARARLGAKASRVRWITSDVLSFRPERRYALWHDRAVLHFLPNPDERTRYLSVLDAALAPEGWVVLATFGPQGPDRCSGLAAQRYAPDEVGALLGARFQLARSALEDHQTPGGKVQQFSYGLWRCSAAGRGVRMADR